MPYALLANYITEIKTDTEVSPRASTFGFCYEDKLLL